MRVANVSKMLKSNPLAALTSTFGRRPASASRLEPRRSFAEVENVSAFTDLDCACARREVDARIVDPMRARRRVPDLRSDRVREDNVEAMDSPVASGDLVAAASTLYAIDPVLYRPRRRVVIVGVRKLDRASASRRHCLIDGHARRGSSTGRRSDNSDIFGALGASTAPRRRRSATPPGARTPSRLSPAAKVDGRAAPAPTPSSG